VPSTTVPPLMTMSCISIPLHRAGGAGGDVGLLPVMLGGC